MAKATAEKVKKAKTPAQLAKIAANQLAYEERNKKIAANRDKANELRAHGYKGSDVQVLRQYVDTVRTIKMEELKAKELQVKKEAEEACRVYVEEAMDGPSGEALKRWLASIPVRNEEGEIVSKGRPATFLLVREFFDFYKFPRVTQELVIS